MFAIVLHLIYPSLGRYTLGTLLNHFFTHHTQQNPSHPAQNNTYQRISLPHLHNQAATQKSRVNPIAINPASRRLLFQTFRTTT